MKLENYEVHLPNYSIGDKIYDKIGPVCESYGKKVLVIGGKKALEAACDKIESYVKQTNLEIIGKEIYGENCTYATVEKLRAMPVYQEADMVFGVGGGKALDTVKCLCITDDKPVFAFPTIASNCSACTSVSIMYNEDGTFLKPHFFVRPVMHSFIDTEIIAKAPSQYMWAGIGDTYAKYYEATISSRDERLEHFEEVYKTYLEIFAKDCMYQVKPYEGICALLEELKRLSVRIAVLSNKPDADSRRVVDELFGKGYFDFVQGQREDIPRKPDPAGVYRIMEAFVLPAGDFLYVGDSGVDMKTGRAAGIFTVGVLWGFRDRKELVENGADAVISKPLELLSHLT